MMSAIMFAFTSCTDKEEIDIKHQANITISVNELMKPFQERADGDFEILEGKSIRIRSYVYNSEGVQVQSCVSSVDDYSDIVTYSSILDNGNYKVVSVADFITGTHLNPTEEWWYISGEDNINTLKVSKGAYYRQWADETLGVVVNDIAIGDKSEEIHISIKPATALFQIIFDYSDVENGDGTGISMYASNCTELFIHSKTQYDVISNLNSTNWEYVSSAAQTQSYNISYDNPMETINDGYIRTVAYRALLPQKDKTFYWDITMLWNDGSVTELSSADTGAIDIEAGKQYQLKLSLDELLLYFDEVPTSRTSGFSKTISLQGSTSEIKNRCFMHKDQSYKVLDIANYASKLNK